MFKHVGIAVAEIDAENRAARNRVDDVRFDLKPADRGDGGVIALLRQPLDSGNHLGRGRQCIAAKIHWARTGVIGLTLKHNLKPGDADNAADQPDRRAGGFKHGALLDVQL